MATGLYNYVVVGDNKIPNDLMPGTAPIRKNSTSRRVILPFKDLFKHQVVSLYLEHGVLDLLSETHSCTKLSSGRCGECFQCAERDWACRQVGIIDPGKD